MVNQQTLTQMVEMARTAMANSYAPYSRFPVGAVIKSASGHFYAGCNVENAAYPEGTCAEAGAIAAMVFAGEQQIHEVVVMGQGDALVTPCGGCRQKIREFAAENTQIHVCGPEGVRKTLTLDELLPYSFGPDNL